MDRLSCGLVHYLESMTTSEKLQEHLSTSLATFPSSAIVQEKIAARCLRSVVQSLGPEEHSHAVDFGRSFVVKEAAIGYVLSHGADSLPRMLGSLLDLQPVLSGGSTMTNVWIDNVEPSSFELHCRSVNPLTIFCLEGLVEKISGHLMGIEGITITKLTGMEDISEEHQVLHISVPAGSDAVSQYLKQETDLAAKADASVCSLDAPSFFNLFPFHLIFDRQCNIMQAGSALLKVFPELDDETRLPADTSFEFTHPAYLTWDFEALKEHARTHPSIILTSQNGLQLKGRVVLTTVPATNPDGVVVQEEAILFLCAPTFDGLGDLKNCGFCLSDLPQQDLSVDMALTTDAYKMDPTTQKLPSVFTGLNQVFPRGQLPMLSENVPISTFTDVGLSTFGAAFLSVKGNSFTADRNSNEAMTILNKLMQRPEIRKAIPLSDLIVLREAVHSKPPRTGNNFHLTTEVLRAWTGKDEEGNQGLMNLLNSDACTDHDSEVIVENELQTAINNTQLPMPEISECKDPSQERGSSGAGSEDATFKEQNLSDLMLRDNQDPSRVNNTPAGSAVVLSDGSAPPTPNQITSLQTCFSAPTTEVTAEHSRFDSTMRAPNHKVPTKTKSGLAVTNLVAVIADVFLGSSKKKLQAQDKSNHGSMSRTSLPIETLEIGSPLATRGSPPLATKASTPTAIAADDTLMFRAATISKIGCPSDKSGRSSVRKRRSSLFISFKESIRWTSKKQFEDSDVDRHCAEHAAMATLLMQPHDELAVAFSTIDHWQYDIFQLSEAAGGRPLSALAFMLFKQGGIISSFKVDEQKLARFLIRIEDGYPPNPYHCKEHAADVLRTLHVIATRGGLVKTANPTQQLETDDSGLSAAKRALSLMTIYLAAIIHDFEHKGVNNQFLVQTGDPLALLYNDVSPMENHHISAAFTLLKDRDCNFLEKLPRKVITCLRTQVIDMVLGTDMKQHFSLISQFQSFVQPVMTAHFTRNGHLKSPGPAFGSGCHDVHFHSLEDDAGEIGKKLGLMRKNSQRQSTGAKWSHSLPAPVLSAEVMVLVWKLALKCADLSNLANAKPVARKWVSLLEEEMFRQGDQEQSNGLPISALMDRMKGGVSLSQPGFFNVVAIPLFSTFAQSFPQASPMLEGANNLLAILYVAEGEEKQASADCSSLKGGLGCLGYFLVHPGSM
eukprot:gene16252-22428_t